MFYKKVKNQSKNAEPQRYIIKLNNNLTFINKTVNVSKNMKSRSKKPLFIQI